MRRASAIFGYYLSAGQPATVGGRNMRLEEHFESSSTLQRNERIKLAASRFDLRFLRPFRADLSMTKSSSFFQK
jgi:hypothetical protein